MRRFVQWRVGDAALLGEANVLPEESQSYLSESGGLHMMFNFWVNQHVFYALASADARPLGKALRATRRLPATAQWAQFLRNHDELDLGRLTKEQRTAVFERLGPDPRMQLYDRGIRRRLAPMLGDRRRLELAYSLMFSLPGTPVLYYGDEIGMGDDLTLPERNPCGRRCNGRQTGTPASRTPTSSSRPSSPRDPTATRTSTSSGSDAIRTPCSGG